MSNRQCPVDGTAGSTVTAAVDWWVINDAASADAVPLLTGKALKDPVRVKVFIDHDTPCGSVDVAVKQRELIRFAESNGCELFNGQGISHQIMLDRFVRPGQVVAGCFGHPAMYGAGGAYAVTLTPQALAHSMERGEAVLTVPRTVRVRLEGKPQASAKDVALFLRSGTEYGLSGARVELSGAWLDTLSPSGRVTLCQMLDAAYVVLAGDDACPPDFTVDLAGIEPLVAGPHSPETVAPAASLAGTQVNEVFIGGCSGGGLEDLRLAAAVLAGRRVPPRVRLMVAPATTEVYRQAADEGIWETFIDAGAIVMNQGCSVCWGKSQGLLDESETLLSTGSRNHRGCAGEHGARVYLCSAAVAAHSALAGTITDGGR